MPDALQPARYELPVRPLRWLQCHAHLQKISILRFDKDQ